MLTPSTSNAKRRPGDTEVLLSLAKTEVFIGKGRAQECYDLAEFDCDLDGRAFQLVKQSTGESYEVFVGSTERICCCRGFERFGHCKHCDTLAALIADGQI